MSGCASRTTVASADRSSRRPCTLYDMTRMRTPASPADSLGTSVPGQIGGADEAGHVAERRRDHLRDRKLRSLWQPIEVRPAGRREKQIAGFDDAPADHEDFRVDDEREIGQTLAEPEPRGLERADRQLVAGHGRRGHHRAGDVSEVTTGRRE